MSNQLQPQSCPKCGYCIPKCRGCGTSNNPLRYELCSTCICYRCYKFADTHIKKIVTLMLCLKKKEINVQKDILKHIILLARPYVLIPNKITHTGHLSYIVKECKSLNADPDGFATCPQDLATCLTCVDSRYTKSTYCREFAVKIARHLPTICDRCRAFNTCRHCHMKIICVLDKNYINQRSCDICHVYQKCRYKNCENKAFNFVRTNEGFCDTCNDKGHCCYSCLKIYLPNSWIGNFRREVSKNCAICTVSGTSSYSDIALMACIAYFRGIKTALDMYIDRHSKILKIDDRNFVATLIFRMTACHNDLRDLRRSLLIGTKGKNRDELIEYYDSYSMYSAYDNIWYIINLPDTVVRKFIESGILI
jgi:hypothetical protein